MTEQTFDWSKFDKQVDLDALKDDVKNAEEHGLGDFPEIPVGKYEVNVKNLELGTSKAGDPMLKIQFKILDGEFAGSLIFYNSVMQPNSEYFGLQVHNNNEMLRALWDADKDEVSFDGFKEYSNLVLDIAEEIIEDGWEYILEKGKNNKGYDTYKILEILD